MMIKANRIVIKVGTSTLTHSAGQPNIRRLEHLVKVLSDMKNAGLEIVLVSSGAVAVGMGKIGLRERPQDMPTKQAVAAIGQCELMYLYDSLFSAYNHTVAQVLLTRDVFDNPERCQHACNTFSRLIEMSVLPIVNENDTVAVEEFDFSDNDRLSAMVAKLIGADALIILSDIDGLYSHNPAVHKTATLLPVVQELTEAIWESAGGSGTTRGTGGMVTKLMAAEITTQSGIDMYIINGTDPENLYLWLDGAPVGTYFPASSAKNERRE